MSTLATNTETLSTITLQPAQTAGKLLCDGKPTNFGDWRDDLNRDGYAVIKAAIPRDRADAYSDKFFSYLEGLYVRLRLM